MELTKGRALNEVKWENRASAVCLQIAISHVAYHVTHTPEQKVSMF